MDLAQFASFFALLSVAACCTAREPHALLGRFPGTDGASHALVDPAAHFTVIEFFSAHCPCQTAHDARLRALAARCRARGAAFVAVDSEADATLERDRREAARRGYEYPILVDPEGAIAWTFQAEYATYAVILDRAGRVLYRGGIDSDRTHASVDATPYLAQACADLLAGHAVKTPIAEVLGCTLMRR